MSGDQAAAPKKRKFLLTKTVNPKWYRRYAHVLPKEEIVFHQPQKEIREEEEMLRLMTTPPLKHDQAEILSKKLAEERDNRVKTVLDILDGKTTNVMESIKKMKPMTNMLDNAIAEQAQRRKSFTLEVPLGWKLPAKSKWNQIKKNEHIKKKLEKMRLAMRQEEIIRRWQKSIRTVRAVIRFGMIMADIARTTGEVFKAFNEMMQAQLKKNEEQGGLFFDRNKYKSENSKMSLNSSTILTLRNLEILRSDEEILNAAVNLRVVKSFGEFPTFFQLIMTRIGWYLEVPSDKVIIREGQPPNNFYFLLSGKAVAVSLRGSAVDGEEGKFDIVRIMEKDSLFGECGMVYGHEFRKYSVTSLETCRLLSVSFDDFNRLVNMPNNGENPEHISLLSQFEFMRFFPMVKLVDDLGDGNIMLFYFAPGKIITRKTSDSPFIYVIKKGSAKVYAEMTNETTDKRHKSITVSNPHRGENSYRSSVGSKVSEVPIMESELYDTNGYMKLPSIDVKPSTPDGTRVMSRVASNGLLKSRRGSVMHKMDADLSVGAPKTPKGRTGMRGAKVSDTSFQEVANDNSLDIRTSFFEFDGGALPEDVHANLKEHGFDVNRMQSSKSLMLSHTSLNFQQNIIRRGTLHDMCKNDDEILYGVQNALNVKKLRCRNSRHSSQGSSEKGSLYADSSLSKLQQAASLEKLITKTKVPEGGVTWVFLKDIRENDYIGLEDIDFGDEKSSCNVSIVSEGCECIMLSKKFFMSHASHRLLSHLRANCDVFPDQAGLHRELRRQQYWTNFKTKTYTMLREKKIHDAKQKKGK